MPDPSTYNEKGLLFRVAEGDERAFAVLFHQYHHELAAYILSITKDPSVTDEIVQDVFIKLWHKREEASSIIHFRSFLFTIARNYTYNVLRNLARKNELEKTWLRYQADIAPTPAGHQEAYLELIDQAVERLPPQRQKVYLMSRREGLKQQMIAEELGISRETVKKHIMAAIGEITDYVRRNSGPASAALILVLAKL